MCVEKSRNEEIKKGEVIFQERENGAKIRVIEANHFSLQFLFFAPITEFFSLIFRSKYIFPFLLRGVGRLYQRKISGVE